jgi:hypothetical protein
MGWKASIRAMEAAERRQQREAQKYQRELERRAKEQTKLSTLEQARLEVETHENRLEVLLSIHKEQGAVWDWSAIAASLPPSHPQKTSYHEYKMRRRMLVMQSHQKQEAGAAVDRARYQDEQMFQTEMQNYSEKKAEWEGMRNLARRILVGESKAYTEALVEVNPFAEISDLGSELHFTVHSMKLLGCELKVNSALAIPSESKTLTVSGKVSVKQMPRSRFHEIYQDYLCSCVLRVAREVFALLPVETVLITAAADIFNPSTGKTVEHPVLSVVIPRAVLAQLDFDRLDPSDAMENFLHRGDFKASRKSGAFLPITPLIPADIAQVSGESAKLGDLVTHVQRVRGELKLMNATLSPRPIPIVSEGEPSS